MDQGLAWSGGTPDKTEVIRKIFTLVAAMKCHLRFSQSTSLSIPACDPDFSNTDTNMKLPEIKEQASGNDLHIMRQSTGIFLLKTS